MAMPFLHALRALRRLLTLALAAAVGAVLLLTIRWPPADLPWTPLDPRAPIGLLTGAKLARLNGNADECRALLGSAGMDFRTLPPRRDGAECGYTDGILWREGGARRARYAPAPPPLACPLALGLAIWEWQVVQPAALRLLGSRVARIDHYGSYACRRIYGRAEGAWSEHARAAAIDVAGFRLADGRRVTVARDWRGHGAQTRFLREARDGACRLFSTTLSPDYNAAHRDHLHLDEAIRGGWRMCG